MSRQLHRHRKFLASTALGIWAFAVLVGVANACIRDDVTAAAHQPNTPAHADADAADQRIAPHCEQPGSNAVPLLGALQWVQDPPAGDPLVLAAIHDLGFPPVSASRLRLARNAHPPPGVPFSLRTVRLTL